MNPEPDKSIPSSSNEDKPVPENDSLQDSTSPGERLRKIISETEPEEISLPDYPLTPGNAELGERYKNEEQSAKSADESSRMGRHPTGFPERTGGWFGDAPVSEVSPKETPTEPHPLDLQAEFWSEELGIADTPVSINNEDTIPPLVEIPLGNNLPHAVDATDVDATRITRAAYEENYDLNKVPPTPARGIPSRRGVAAPPVVPAPDIKNQPVPVSLRVGKALPVQKPSPTRIQTPPKTQVSTKAPPNRGKPVKKRKPVSCFFQLVIISFFIILVVLLSGASYAVYRYYQVAATLPDVATLRERASQFETTRILDRNGNVLYEILDPNAGRRTFVRLEQISPNLIAATLATEDKDFYNNPGFDPLAIARALWQNYTSGEVVSGASTITQQLARMVLMTQEERIERTNDRKAREIILAAEITRRYSKDEILELYLNENFYSNMSYGIEAAAETYFNTTAANLTIGQSAFLAGLPQSPGIYDILITVKQPWRAASRCWC